MKTWYISNIKIPDLDNNVEVIFALHHLHRLVIFFHSVIRHRNGLGYEYHLLHGKEIIAKISTSHFSDIPGYILEELDNMSVEEDGSKETD